MQTYIYSGLTSLVPPFALIFSRLLFSDEAFALFSIFILINALVMFSDVGITASIFKYLSEYLHGRKAAIFNVQKAIFVGKYLKSMALLIIFLYSLYIVYSWSTGINGIFLIAIFVLSANNRWHFAIIKTFLFSNQKSLFFWRTAFIFSSIKYLTALFFGLYNFEISFILSFILIFSYIEIFYLKNNLNEKLSNIYYSKTNPKKINFDYMLGISSFLWVIILQLDKVYFSIAYNQEYFIKYSLFLQLCTGFFIISSTMYSIYGKDLYGKGLTRDIAYLNALRGLSSIFIFIHIFIWNTWIYEYFFEYMNINIFHNSVISSYLLLMFIQPTVILLINCNDFKSIVIAYIGGVFIWLLFSQINIYFSWISQAAFIFAFLVFFMKKNYSHLFSIKIKIIFYIMILLLPAYLFMNFLYNDNYSNNILSIIILFIFPIINWWLNTLNIKKLS